jgi:hypothetical protein
MAFVDMEIAHLLVVKSSFLVVYWIVWGVLKKGVFFIFF